MNSAQRIIKYLAIAFAVFLAANIIFGIVTAAVSILFVFDGATLDSDLEETKVGSNFSKIYQDITSIDLEVGVSKLYIKQGNEFKVEANNVASSFKVQNDNGTLIIKEKNKNNIFNMKKETSTIYIYIPKDTILNKAKISTGVGKSSIEYLNVKNLDLEIGVGDLSISNVTSSDTTDIDGGVGKVNINSCSFNNLDLDCGVGNFEIYSDITGNSKIDCGVGNFYLEVDRNIENYTIVAEVDLGSVKINGNKVNSEYKYGNGKNYLKIDGGIGNVDVKFSDKSNIL